jgi:electron transfer flavoprotein alpha subunit
VTDVLAFVEHTGGGVRGARGELAAARRVADRLGGAVHALVLGAPGVEEEIEPLGPHGADEVRVGCHVALETYVPEPFARIVAQAARVGRYGAVVFPATAQGRDLAPRVATLLDVPLVTDVTDVHPVDGGFHLVRPIHGGKVNVRLSVDASPFVFSTRPSVVLGTVGTAPGVVHTFTVEEDPARWRSRLTGFEPARGDGYALDEASVVITGGRGMGGPDHWGLLEDLKDAFGHGAALGASRGVVDAGWRPRGEEVGLTGKAVSPELYLAIGVSGRGGHPAGMRTAGKVVVINRDRTAPIFDVADYGIVGDLFEIVPRLTRELRARRRAT